MLLSAVCRGFLLLLLACASLPSLAAVRVEVRIEGLEPALEENARLFLSIVQQKDNELLGEGRLRRLHQKAPQEIGRALQPYGYYRSRVTSRLERQADGAWLASYRVDIGEPIKIARLDFMLLGEAQQDEPFRELAAKSPLRPGARFIHGDYEKLKSDLAKLASDRGYLDAQFSKHRVEVDLQAYQAHIELHFDSGFRYHFGQVHFSSEALDADLLNAFIPFQPGDPYRVIDLIELQQLLNDSDYFRVVEVSHGMVDPAAREVSVDVRLVPRLKDSYTLGLGYGTDTGARAQVGWSMPRLNSRGHRISTQAKVSELGYEVNAKYSLPVFDPRTDQLIYSAGIVNEKTDTSDSTIQTIGVALNHRRGEWRESLALNYQVEKFTVGDDSGRTQLLIPGVNWSRTWGQEFWGNRIVPAFSGVRLDLGFRTANVDLASDVDFSQVFGSIKAIHRFNRSHRLISRFKGGRIDTRDFERLPTSVRFFAGGAQSVRGFAYHSLGPRDEDGDVTGGQYLLEGSLEYEYSFNPRWGMAIFFDTGDAVNDLDDSLEQGAGIGLRWNSLIGPVRVDVASALTEEDKPWRLHINIGPDL